MGLFRAGTWHLSGGEKHDGPQVIYLKLFQQYAIYNDFKKVLIKSNISHHDFIITFLNSAYCWDNFYVNKLIEMHGENNNVKFTKDLSLD